MEDYFNEYMDPDALSCIDDYNRFEETQLALDRDLEYDPWSCYDYDESDYEDPSLGISDDNWACGTLDVE